MWIKYQIWNNLLLVIFYACWGKRRKCMRVNQRCTKHTWYARASISFFFSYFIHLQFLWHWEGWEEKVWWSKDLARLKANNFCYKFSINQITYLLNLVLIHLNLVVVSSFWLNIVLLWFLVILSFQEKVLWWKEMARLKANNISFEFWFSIY